MKKLTTKQLTCTEGKEKQPFDIWKAAKATLIWGVKALLRSWLMNPSTWHFAMVTLPGIMEKLEQFLKDGISYLIDLFT